MKVGRVSSKNQVTLPVDLMHAARIRAGDQVRFDIDEHGQICVSAVRRAPDLSAFIGVWKGRTPYGDGRELTDDLRGPVQP